MLSQNAVRIRKNMTLPCVLHGVFTAVEVTLAEAFEGEVRSVPLDFAHVRGKFSASFPKI